jgi:hypothetical protein
LRENRRGEPLLPKFIRKNSKSARNKLQAEKKETGVKEETEKNTRKTKNKGSQRLGKRAKGGNPESKNPLLGEEKALPLEAPERIPS